jgi:flagellar hook-basal body complex protein FliE
LTQGQQTQNQDMQSFALNLLNQALNRDVSGAQIGVQEKQIGNQNEQFYQTLQEQIRQFNEQQRAAERQSLFNNIFKGIAAGTSIASGGLVPGIKSLFSGIGGGNNRNVLTNPINPYATTNPYAGIPA